MAVAVALGWGALAWGASGAEQPGEGAQGRGALVAPAALGRPAPVTANAPGWAAHWAAAAAAARERPRPAAEEGPGAEAEAAADAAADGTEPAAAGKPSEPAGESGGTSDARGGETGAPSGATGEEGRAAEAPAEAQTEAPQQPEDGNGQDGADGPGDRGDGGGMEPCTLVVGGAAIPYRDVRGGTTPASGAGLWLGSDAADDGSWGYFVGHNPGDFSPVAALGEGSPVVLCDSRGVARTYTVRVRFTVESTATWKTIASRVTGFGESVILQTCLDATTNLIVVAA